ILYPFRFSVPLWQGTLAALLLIAITAAALRLCHERPYLAVGWVWFVAGLLPASGLVQSGRQGMADRFTYLPMIGLAMAVIWLTAGFLGKHRRAAATAISVSIVAAFAVATWSLIPVWHDSV